MAIFGSVGRQRHDRDALDGIRRVPDAARSEWSPGRGERRLGERRHRLENHMDADDDRHLDGRRQQSRRIADGKLHAIAFVSVHYGWSSPAGGTTALARPGALMYGTPASLIILLSAARSSVVSLRAVVFA